MVLHVLYVLTYEIDRMFHMPLLTVITITIIDTVFLSIQCIFVSFSS